MKKLVLVSVLGALLTGCGGGGGGSDKDSSHSEHRPSAAQGTIERVSGNTVTVNGHQYDVASVSYSTVELSPKDLEPGMIVSLSANKTRSSGSRLQLEPTMAGFITITDESLGKFTVNGVPLVFEQLSTIIDRELIIDGNWVMVSALPAPNLDTGYKVLSIVKFDDADLLNMFEVEGIASSITNSTFKLGAALTVDYTNSVVEDGPLEEGVWVEVEGNFDSLSNSTVIANKVEVESYDEVENDTEIEGVITQVAQDKSSFVLNSRGRFQVTSQTRFDDGDKRNLIEGAMVEVTIGRNNVALEIEFEDNDNDLGDWDDNEIEFKGTVTQTSDDDTHFTLSLESTGQKHTVYVNKFTEYDDGLTFDTLTNEEIEVEAYLLDGKYIANEIEQRDYD
ncbi:DUF5666 domain-containing protein [Vibrio fluminensis]|uniref:DUF5666 domain-containing protein n=1 Tax=Vibrio fluminensis TaxID=2783614 RepID=UPI00188797C9|nr:DUF5666 domain-containing protein [Vibrio fluminensis]